MNKIKFFMQRVDIKEPVQPVRDLELDFPGLRYSVTKGMETIGESRVCEEEYAESNTIKVYIPETPLNKTTKIEMKLYFTGDKFQQTYDSFNEYIRTGVHKFWDDKRNREFTFYVKDKIEPSEVMWYGGIPYIEVTYKLSNINGKTKTHI